MRAAEDSPECVERLRIRRGNVSPRHVSLFCPETNLALGSGSDPSQLNTEQVCRVRSVSGGAAASPAVRRVDLDRVVCRLASFSASPPPGITGCLHRLGRLPVLGPRSSSGPSSCGAAGLSPQSQSSDTTLQQSGPAAPRPLFFTCHARRRQRRWVGLYGLGAGRPVLGGSKSVDGPARDSESNALTAVHLTRLCAV